jgi:glutamyl-Q tRNA(Asp) synthetase
MYIGRFAPSPTGPLHFGSLVAALAGWLDARTQDGRFLVRIEDVDAPRCSMEAERAILASLTAHGLTWDGDVVLQRERGMTYQAAADALLAAGHAYPCACTRREIADSAVAGFDGLVYPGTCRDGLHGKPARALRVRTDSVPYAFTDALQGTHSQALEPEVGDFVIRRGDGLWAYQLAVVVDDAAAGVTEVVRGTDLLGSTARQLHLQRLLGLATPRYAHLPIAVGPDGTKLAKQTGAAGLDDARAAGNLVAALRFLDQNPPATLERESVSRVLDWARAHWDRARLAGVATRPAPVI